MYNLNPSGTPDDGGLFFPTPNVTAGGEGWLGRVGAGCDYQITSNIVIGAFGDYDFSGIGGTFTGAYSPAFGSTFYGNANQSSAWAFGGRIGYLVTPALLTYFDGGFTQSNFDAIHLSTYFTGLTCCGFQSQTYSGWFIGGGTEYALTFLPIPGLFWRTEYRYSSYSGETLVGYDFTSGTPNYVNENMRPTVQTITTSLVWRFNWAAPLAARY